MKMAKVIIEAAKVERLIPGYGFAATESHTTKDGEVRKTWFTVWTKNSVSVGDIMAVEGELSVKVSEYTDKKTNQLTSRAEANINNAKLMQSNDAPF